MGTKSAHFFHHVRLIAPFAAINSWYNAMRGELRSHSLLLHTNADWAVHVFAANANFPFDRKWFVRKLTIIEFITFTTDDSYAIRNASVESASAGSGKPSIDACVRFAFHWIVRMHASICSLLVKTCCTLCTLLISRHRDIDATSSYGTDLIDRFIFFAFDLRDSKEKVENYVNKQFVWIMSIVDLLSTHSRLRYWRSIFTSPGSLAYKWVWMFLSIGDSNSKFNLIIRFDFPSWTLTTQSQLKPFEMEFET